MFRQLSEAITKNLQSEKPQITLILGLRQTGKTTLAKTVCEGKKFQLFNFDLPSDQQEFAESNRHSLEDFAQRYRDHIIFIDEVQKLPESTGIIKHLYDQYGIKFILTGSSELKIKEHLSDSLAGRVRQFKLYPLTIKEILVQKNMLDPEAIPEYDMAQTALQKYLVYGSLPNLENITPEDYPSYLKNFTDTLLSKDVLEISEIKNSTKIFTLAKLLAMQVGQLVNVNELATLLELNRATVYNYLDILEQLNVICRAYPMSTNQRQAISTKFKVYFTDLGIRNVLINNLNTLQNRLDMGALLENAVYMGLKRQLDYKGEIYELGFFRSSSGSEIDIVLRISGEESLYEVKSSKRYARKKGDVKYITQENAWEFLI